MPGVARGVGQTASSAVISKSRVSQAAADCSPTMEASGSMKAPGVGKMSAAGSVAGMGPGWGMRMLQIFQAGPLWEGVLVGESGVCLPLVWAWGTAAAGAAAAGARGLFTNTQRLVLVALALEGESSGPRGEAGRRTRAR